MYGRTQSLWSLEYFNKCVFLLPWNYWIILPIPLTKEWRDLSISAPLYILKEEKKQCLGHNGQQTASQSDTLDACFQTCKAKSADDVVYSRNDALCGTDVIECYCICIMGGCKEVAGSPSMDWYTKVWFANMIKRHKTSVYSPTLIQLTSHNFRTS